jgi:2,3,4,5-tetrahydropyridine-2-carboxylate N-succinyltransferase
VLDPQLAQRIEACAATPAGAPLPGESESLVIELLDALERGEVRAAERKSDGRWQAVPWVGQLRQFGGDSLSFVDKHTYPIRRFDVTYNVRLVPGGSSIRRGTYVASGVVCMPPMYINVGAYVDTGTMIDSHALVGSCAQVGKHVHVSAAAQIGGVLEPVNATPVVIEDDVLVGGNCGVYEGTIVREGAVLAAGVVLTRGTPVFDLVHETIYKATPESPLEIPPAAVVVPGSRGIAGGWAGEHRLGLQAPVIVKYRDEKTDLATTLESWLR